MFLLTEKTYISNTIQIYIEYYSLDERIAKNMNYSVFITYPTQNSQNAIPEP